MRPIGVILRPAGHRTFAERVPALITARPHAAHEAASVIQRMGTTAGPRTKVQLAVELIAQEAIVSHHLPLNMRPDLIGKERLIASSNVLTHHGRVEYLSQEEIRRCSIQRRSKSPHASCKNSHEISRTLASLYRAWAHRAEDYRACYAKVCRWISSRSRRPVLVV